MVVPRGKVRRVRVGTRYQIYGTHQGSSETVKSGFPTLVEIEQGVEGGFILVTIDAAGPSLRPGTPRWKRHCSARFLNRGRVGVGESG